MNNTLHQRSWSRVMGYYLFTIVVIVLYLLFVNPLHSVLSEGTYLDLRTHGYTMLDVHIFFEKLGIIGRAFYVRSTIFDTIWPAAVALTCYLSARRSVVTKDIALLICCAPIAFGILDIIENAGLLIMLFTYPEIPSWTLEYASNITILKHQTIPLAAVQFLGLLCYSFYMWFKER